MLRLLLPAVDVTLAVSALLLHVTSSNCFKTVTLKKAKAHRLICFCTIKVQQNAQSEKNSHSKHQGGKNEIDN